MSKEDVKRRMMEDPDFIRCLKCGNSLSYYLANNHEEIQDKTIARLLMLSSEEEVEKIYLEAAEMLKKKMAKSE